MNVENSLAEWLRLAEMDLATAHHMFETYHPKPLEIVCFHAQQAAEKMLKAFLVSHSIEPPKTHDMQVLCEMCVECDARINDVYEPAVLLSRYAVMPRYPAEIEILEHDAVSAIIHTDTVVEFIKGIITRRQKR